MTDNSVQERPTHVGSGWISGTLSVVISLIGLGAVLCFHFPEYLTIPEIRTDYPLPVMRAIVHFVLVTGFLMGLLSIMLRRNKTLGLTGMGIVLLAALLGGSRVPINGDLNSDIYLGLDYVLLILILYSAMFIPLEKLFGRLRQGVFRQGWRVDLTYFFVSTLLVQLTTYLTLQPAAVLFSWSISSSIQEFVSSQPGWLQFLEIMFLADLVQYWVHRLFHQIPWLWPFHAIHHSAQVMDWLAGNRLHIVDLAITRSLIYIPSFVLGFDDVPMVCYIVFVSLHSVFIHANLRFEFGLLNWIFATPRFHHWHHGIEAEAIDKNFAVHFPILDWVFGTFYMPGKDWPRGYGVHHGKVPESYLAQWLYPFLRRSPATDASPTADGNVEHITKDAS